MFKFEDSNRKGNKWKLKTNSINGSIQARQKTMYLYKDTQGLHSSHANFYG